MEPNDDSPRSSRNPPADTLTPSKMLALVASGRPAAGDAAPAEAAPKGRWRSRLAVSAAVVLIAAAASAATLVLASRPQAERLAQSLRAAQTIAESVLALNARLDSLEKAKPRDDLDDLRRAVGELKSSSSHELEGALARLSQRIESLDREQSVKVDRLAERLDQTAQARGADLAQRLDKLEKKVAAPPPPAPQSEPQSAAKAAPKLGPNVAMEPTGSIKASPPARERPGPALRERPVLSGYVVLGARPDAALIGDAWGERAVRVGDFVPGVGRVERIERHGPAWIVQTNAGIIPAANAEPD